VNIDELAVALNVQPSYIYKILTRSKQSDAYEEFQITSKNRHGSRTITKPCDEIKIFQKKLLSFLEEKSKLKACVHGFVKGKSNVTNARRHVGKTCVLNLDLKNFFPSINFGRVRGILTRPPLSFNLQCATVVSQICCYKKVLPQGAPTSPILANLVASKLDNAMINLSHALRFEYTRYADDLTFSTRKNNFPKSIAFFSEGDGDEKNVLEIGEKIRNIIEGNGFTINESKKRLSRYGTQRKCVTGIVVNEKCNLRRDYYRHLCAVLYECKRDINEAMRKNEMLSESALKNWIKGKIAYYKHVVGCEHPSYNRICHDYNRAFGEYYKGINFKLAILESSAVFRIKYVFPDGTSRILSSTAFHLNGVGLVTNKHALNLKYTDNRLSPNKEQLIKSNTEIYQAGGAELECRITSIKLVPNVDLVVLEFESDCYIPYFKKREEAVTKKESLTLLGYPEERINDDINVRHDIHYSATKIDTDTEQKYYRLATTPVLLGDSGGPLIDYRYRVVGIATRGGKTVHKCLSPNAFNGALPISYLSDLAGSE